MATQHTVADRGRPGGARHLLAGLLGVLAGVAAGACSSDRIAAVQAAARAAAGGAADWRFRGAWLAPRQGAPLDSDEASAALVRMRELGVDTVAIGWDVEMPSLSEPALVWGQRDEELRSVLGRVRSAGLRVLLMPRIESPDFFRPPYPFRADIRFGTEVQWEAFHDQLEAMVVHYARVAEREQVAVFALGLELKQSVLQHEQRWREMIAAVRRVYSGSLTYSANWYEEWNLVRFWDALDYIGIGAYFELHPRVGESGADPVADLRARWTPIRAELLAIARSYDKPLLFTEVGYPGWADCVERPWEWAGKAGTDAAVDHVRQAQAFAALLSAFADTSEMAGAFLWTFHTKTRWVQEGEYGIAGRPAAEVVERAFGAK